MKVLIPNSVPLTIEAPPDSTLVVYDVSQPIPAEHRDAEALVVWGNAGAAVEEAARTMPALRWVQTLAAGPNALLGAGFADEVVLTSGRGLHDGTVAEHSLALLLAACRRLHEMRDAQRQGRWPGQLGGLQPIRPEGEFRTLDGARLLVWGFGSIAARLAPLLSALGAEVEGIARSAGERHGYKVHAESELEAPLSRCDALVMILPTAPGTRHALNAARLALLPPHAWLVNVGRGDTVDERALIAALSAGQLAGAALDVFEEEPLPETSPLWSMPNVIVSPHAAGGRPVGAAELIQRNLFKLQAGQPLDNVVDRQRGY